jgi:lipid-A-disaccharide synthase
MTAARLIVIAGETSGDRLGAALLAELSTRLRTETAGIGGPQMQGQGLECWWRADELAVFGLVEVVRHLPRLLRLRRQLLHKIIAWQPDLVVTIDAPDFNLPLAIKLRQNGIRVLHYVCPSVWAWRQGRVRTLRRAVDRVMCLLPFEAEFLHRHGVPASYTGHPLVPGLLRFRQDPQQRSEHLRSQLGWSTDDIVLALLPGSRDSEIRRLWPLFLRTAMRLPQPLQMVTCAISAEQRQWMQQQQQALAPECHIHWLEPAGHGSWQALRMADVALLASGTVTLEALLLETPMVVSYRLHALTWMLLKHLRLYKAAHVSLPNLLAGKRVVPELLQQAASADNLAAAIHALLGEQGQQQSQQLRAIGNRMLAEQGDAEQPLASAAEVVCAVLRDDQPGC